MKNNVSLTLSGGGIRSAASIGVIKYLEENNINIEALSGSSGGSIISFLYGLTGNINIVEQFIKEFNILDIFDIKNFDFISLKNLEKRLIEFSNKKQFKKQVIVCTTDLKTGKSIYFDSNKVSKQTMIEAVIASSSLQPLFRPKKIGKYLLIDGGYTDNLPNIVFENRYNISVNVNNVDKKSDISFSNIVKRILLIVMNSNIRESAKKADVFINVDTLHNVNILSFSKIDMAIKEGYKIAKKTIEKNKKEKFKVVFYEESK